MAMSVIGAGPDEDRTRFFRLSLVIIDELTTILRDLLHNEIQPKDICIKATKLDLPNVRAGQSILLSNAKIEGYKNFDTTLLYTLLRNACPNTHLQHNNGEESMKCHYQMKSLLEMT